MVPIVVQGAHKTWSKDTYTVRATPIHVRVLAPMATEHWTEEGIDAALGELRDRFIDNLPEDQQPATDTSLVGAGE